MAVGANRSGADAAPAAALGRFIARCGGHFWTGVSTCQCQVCPHRREVLFQGAFPILALRSTAEHSALRMVLRGGDLVAPHGTRSIGHRPSIPRSGGHFWTRVRASEPERRKEWSRCPPSRALYHPSEPHPAPPRRTGGQGGERGGSGGARGPDTPPGSAEEDAAEASLTRTCKTTKLGSAGFWSPHTCSPCSNSAVPSLGLSGLGGKPGIPRNALSGMVPPRTTVVAPLTLTALPVLYRCHPSVVALKQVKSSKLVRGPERRSDHHGCPPVDWCWYRSCRYQQQTAPAVRRQKLTRQTSQTYLFKHSSQRAHAMQTCKYSSSFADAADPPAVP